MAVFSVTNVSMATDPNAPGAWGSTTKPAASGCKPHSTDPRGQAAFTEQGKRLTKWDDWNDVRILCEGNVTKMWFNGELRVHFVDTDEEHNTLEGFFGLQTHSGKKSLVTWKDLRIKELNK